MDCLHVQADNPWYNYYVVNLGINTIKLEHSFRTCTVKPVFSGHSKIDRTKVLMANFSLMKVESIAECSLALLEHSANF